MQAARKTPDLTITSAAILTLLFLVAVGYRVHAEPLPVQASRLHPSPETGLPGSDQEPVRHTRPKQGHMGPMVFSIDPRPAELLQNYIQLYMNRKNRDWLEAAYHRGLFYRDFIMEELVRQKAPMELLFLPVIESEYINRAVSVSGAAGIWQFMLNSIYPDMYITEWMDDRRDFTKATRSAIDKLLFNYSFLGDWHLALAAYNCGLTCVNDTLKSAEERDYWTLSSRGLLPVETIHYVPRFLAAAYILSYPGRHGIETTWREPVQWEQIRVEHPVDLRMLADRADVPPDVLLQANGELYYAITPPGNIPYSLKVPAQYTDQIKRTLEAEEMRLVHFYIYSIQAGDTVYALARHYGVSENMIYSYNPGIRPQTLQIGSRLLIPALRQVPPYPGRKTASSQNNPPESSLFSERYTVRKGDTLWGLSRRFNTSVERLVQENNITGGQMIRTGQILNVPPGIENGEGGNRLQ